MVNGTTQGPPIRADGNGSKTMRRGTATEKESQDDKQKMHLSYGSKKQDGCTSSGLVCQKSIELFRGWPWPGTHRNGFVVKQWLVWRSALQTNRIVTKCKKTATICGPGALSGPLSMANRFPLADYDIPISRQTEGIVASPTLAGLDRDCLRFRGC